MWFDPLRSDETLDEDLEAELRLLEPSFDWSVKNQARMHARNGDMPYRSSGEAMRHWPEISAPCGLDDLTGGVLRPTPRFAEAEQDAFLDRVKWRRWMDRWPKLTLSSDDAGP